jgi:hypothetical protein
MGRVKVISHEWLLPDAVSEYERGWAISADETYNGTYSHTIKMRVTAAKVTMRGSPNLVSGRGCDADEARHKTCQAQ